MPSGKSFPKGKKVMVKSDNESSGQNTRGGPVLFNKLIPKGITQTIFRRNKNQTQILQGGDVMNLIMLPYECHYCVQHFIFSVFLGWWAPFVGL
jgi:hypothetical protein